MATRQPDRRAKEEQPITPLAEIYRRVVRIHAAIATASRDDPDLRRWSLEKLMDLLRYIEQIEDAQEAQASTG